MFGKGLEVTKTTIIQPEVTAKELNIVTKDEAFLALNGEFRKGEIVAVGDFKIKKYKRLGTNSKTYLPIYSNEIAKVICPYKNDCDLRVDLGCWEGKDCKAEPEKYLLFLKDLVTKNLIKKCQQSCAELSKKNSEKELSVAKS